MSFKPYISIIIPIYKVEKYIERCIRSVMEQTFVALPVECILVDDCGGDNSIQIAENLIQAYNGPYLFKIICNDQNKGLAVSRNNGIKASSGQYVYFIDSDDHIAPNCIELLVQTLQKYPHVDVILGNSLFVKFHRLLNNIKRIPTGPIQNKIVLKLFFRGHIQDAAWNMLIKSSIITRNHLFFIPNMIHEDTNWVFRLFTMIDTMVFVPEITHIYEDNPSSIMNTSPTINYNSHIEGNIINTKFILDHFPNTYYVDATLFIIGILVRELDSCNHNNVLPTLKKQLKKIRNRLFYRDIKNLRLVLVLYEFQLFAPFRHITKWSVYRRNYHYMTLVIRIIALFFSPLHIFHHKTSFSLTKFSDNGDLTLQNK